MSKQRSIDRLLAIMARLRAPDGCPWDREQDHHTLRWHAVEEVYELIDAIESNDDHELEEELGDLLLQVVFHCQLAQERGAFDFGRVAKTISDKLVRRHPHVFGNTKVKDVDQVWANWEKIKRAEKHGTTRARPSALDGIPKHLPALMHAEKLIKKAKKAKLLETSSSPVGKGARKGVAKSIKKRAPARSRGELATELFELAAEAFQRGWSAEDLLRAETRKRERHFRKLEQRSAQSPE